MATRTEAALAGNGTARRTLTSRAPVARRRIFRADRSNATGGIRRISKALSTWCAESLFGAAAVNDELLLDPFYLTSAPCKLISDGFSRPRRPPADLPEAGRSPRI